MKTVVTPTQARLKELFDYNPDTGEFIRKTSVRGPNCKIGLPTSNVVNSVGYLRIMVDGIRYQAHRLAWVYIYGDISENLVIDHINRDRADNRLCNLRLVTQIQNTRNRKINVNNTTGNTGIYWHKRDECWSVCIGHGYKLKHLGYFKDRESAELARDIAEKKCFS